MTAPSRPNEGPDRFLAEFAKMVKANSDTLRGMERVMKLNVFIVALNAVVVGVYCVLVLTTDIPMP